MPGRTIVLSSSGGDKDGDATDLVTRRKIDKQMAAIALPALAGLTIDPIASLVDTAMIGRFCAASDLAGAGVAISVYNLIARTFNFLSSATTSQVAALAPADGEAGGTFLTCAGLRTQALLPPSICACTLTSRHTLESHSPQSSQGRCPRGRRPLSR